MKAVKHPGICKLCGQYKDLTLEHIPPKSAFNSNTVKVFSVVDVVKQLSEENSKTSWNAQDFRGTIQQGGHKRYCLCRSCNNNTGQWYMRTYTDMTKTIHAIIVNHGLITGHSYSFIIRGFYPLRLYKAMMTMLCDINNDCFGDESLRQFLMNKDSKSVNLSKYSLYMYLVSTQRTRICDLSTLINSHRPEEPVMVSEVASYPIGFALYIDKPESYTPFGVNIDSFASFSYDEKGEIDFKNVPYVDLNSHLPVDYRSKDNIIKSRKQSKKVMENNHA